MLSCFPTFDIGGDVVDEGQQVLRPLVCDSGTVVKVAGPVSHGGGLKKGQG